MEEIINKDETFKIVGAAIVIHKTLGNGFLEAVYHEALMIEFEKREFLIGMKNLFSLNTKRFG